VKRHAVRFFGRERAGVAAVVLCATVVVVALAVLQYRWNTEASDATGVRLADALQLSMINWHLDLFRNLSEVCLTMRSVDPDSDDQVAEYSRRLADWRSIARYPELVKDVSIVRRRDDTPLPAVEPAQARQLTESFYNIGGALRDWRFDPSIPALTRPAGTPSPDGTDWIVIALDETVLRERILPDLAHRYFQGTNGLDYEVAVVRGSRAPHVIYTSDAGFGEGEVADADGRMDVFGRAEDRVSTSAVSVFHRTSENRGPTAAVGISWFPLLREIPREEDWQLVVRHRRGGPLGAFVADMRRRGLAVSFGALALLVVSMSLLVVTSIRAQRLGRLQMDFVTAVSHELRTPLTIIGSAADNIANGVVDTPAQLQEYGSIIGNEVGQLSAQVERILLFAAARDGQQRYVMQSLRPAEIIDAVLASTERLIRAAHFSVERDIPADLPTVTGDLMAVSQCFENLVTNALKYGKDQRWMCIRARSGVNAEGAPEVRISVSDRGIGIDPADLPRIFEPFYRSAAARTAQIHGTGLGLALARQIADAMGGSLTATSVPGQGSTFTLALRCDIPGHSVSRTDHTLDVFTSSLHTPPAPRG
jgi:signal transduction histidine kinase